MLRFGWQQIAVAIALAAAPGICSARVSPGDYRAVGIAASPNAAVPKSALLIDENGEKRALGSLIAASTVLVFADFTCRTLCGPTVAFVASALEQSGLRPNEQFRLLVVGLDPRDRAEDATRMRRDHIGDSAVGNAATFLTADKNTIEALTSALGYRYRYDAEADQYVHPAAAFVLRADGKVSRVLTGLGLSGPDMRLALIEAGEGHIGTLGDQVRLLCSAFDPAHGTYNLLISRMLAGAATITIALLAGGIGCLVLIGRRPA
jgi:protein SCO1/2